MRTAIFNPSKLPPIIPEENNDKKRKHVVTISQPSRDFSFPLVPQIYDERMGIWVDAPNLCSPKDALSFGNLQCVTYNVLFKNWYLKFRALALLDLLQKKEPDVICLQEVTPPFVLLLASNPWFRGNYYLSDSDGETCAPYGVLMLVKRTLAQYFVGFRQHILPSRMERTLLVAHFVSSQGTVHVATSHFESLNNGHLRVQQLDKCIDILGLADHAILMGDLNFSDDPVEHGQENDKLKEHSEWIDLGAESSDGSPSTTLLRESDAEAQHVQGRVDRVLARSNRIELVHWERLGADPIDTSELRLSSSADDHAPLLQEDDEEVLLDGSKENLPVVAQTKQNLPAVFISDHCGFMAWLRFIL